MMGSLINKADYAVWKSGIRHRKYVCKLIHALRQVRCQNSIASPPTRAVREAADRALAIAAQGRTRWSRAILSTRTNRRLTRKPRKIRAAGARIQKTVNLQLANSGIKKTALENRVRALGRLVPGCRKLPSPVILDEAMDYIAALEMQVTGMRVVAELLSQPAPSEMVRLERTEPSSLSDRID